MSRGIARDAVRHEISHSNHTSISRMHISARRNWTTTRHAAWRSPSLARGVTGNVALTCRDYRISWQALWSWHRRYRGRRPGQAARNGRCTARTRRLPSQPGKIIYLHRTYHLGPARISMCPRATTTSRSRFWGVPNRQGADLARLPVSQRCQRHGRQ